MANIRQNIPSFAAGMSEQADHLKFPGQVRSSVNAVPDVTDGLYKRPGAKRIGTTKLASVQNGGSWFHYYRDEDEGSYLGQVAADGQLRVWNCTTGALMTTEYGARTWYDKKWYKLDKVQNGNKIYEAQAIINTGTAAPTHSSGTTNNWKFIENESAAQTRIQNYLATNDSENIQFLTINDTTFVNSRDASNANTLVGVTGTTDTRPTGEEHCAFVELVRTENGRQYAVNIYDSSAINNETTVNRATKVKITGHNFDESDGTGYCPGIGTEVFSITAAGSYTTASGIVHVKDSDDTEVTSGKDNLVLRLTALGQQGISPNYGAQQQGPGGDNYRCNYNFEVVLLHGGEGWVTGDVVRVNPTYANEAHNVTTSGNPKTTTGSQAYMEVTVMEHESTQVKATVSSAGDGLLRPSPTPFDAQTAVTAEAILGGISTGLPSGINAKVIGTGVYYSSANPFTVEVMEDDIMRVFQKSVNDVSRLPTQCRHGYIVKVTNSRVSDEDDYYLKFEGSNDIDGAGSWVECAQPGIDKTLTNMPLVIQRTGTTEFTVREFKYADRNVGDDFTNPMPSFVEKRINKICFFRNRLAFLAGENVVLSRPGTLGEPDFFVESALAVGAADAIDIACASTFPSAIFDGIEVNSGLLVFSTNQQFLLSSDAEILNPETAKLRSVATYNYNKDISPISLGVTVAYVDNSGKFSRFNEVANIRREGEPNVVEPSKVVPTLLEKNIDLLTNSRENSIVLFGKTNTDTVFGYRYFNVGDKREQQAWFKWKFNRPLLYHFIINDDYFFVDSDHFLQTLSIVQDDDDISLDQDGVNYLIHLDNYTTLAAGTYDVSTNKTTFTNKATWIPDVTSPNGALVVIDNDSLTTRIGRYAEPTMLGNNPDDDFTLPGDWSREVTTITVTNGGSGYTSAPTVTISGGSGSGAQATATIKNGAVTSVDIVNNGYNYTSAPTVAFTGGGGSSAAATAAIHGGTYNIGYLYEYSVEFPTIYPTQVEGEKSASDVNGSLVLHRVKLHFGKAGLYETTLTRTGKPNYTEVYESTELDEYEVSDAPFVEDVVRTVPVYERNTNVGITLKSSHPSPATLRAMAWEGSFTPRFYRRV